MRLRISLCLLLAALWLALPGYAATITSYPVGNLGLDVVDYGGIVVDKGGNIWFAARFELAVPTRPALCRLDPVKNRVTTFRLPTVIEEVGSLAYDAPRNIIWIADSVGHRLCKFNIIKSILTVYELPVYNGDLADIQSIAVDGYGKVFCALYLTDAVGVFNPAAPTTLALWDASVIDIEPYSIVSEADGEIAWFTSGEDADGGWFFGHLDTTVPEFNTWDSTAASDIDTLCLRWDASAGTVGRLFMTGINTDTVADEVGRFDPAVAATLNRYSVCADPAGLYGLDLELGNEIAWVAEWEVPGAAALVDASGAGAGTVALTAATVAAEYSTASVPRPWVYQMQLKWCPLRPNTYVVDDRCEDGPAYTQEFQISPTSQPGAVAVKAAGEAWMADTYDDTIVKIVEIPV